MLPYTEIDHVSWELAGWVIWVAEKIWGAFLKSPFAYLFAELAGALVMRELRRWAREEANMASLRRLEASAQRAGITLRGGRDSRV